MKNGTRFVMDFQTLGLKGVVTIRTAWIIDADEIIPRLTSCYVKGQKVMKDEIKILDAVAVVEDLPELGLRRGEVGTVVDAWKDGAFEVEFSDEQARHMLLSRFKQTN